MFYAQFIPCWQSTNAQFLATYFEDAVVIADDYERSSVNVADSTISGVGDAAVITLKPRVQESEVVSSQTRWLEPSAKVTGINGYRPTFRFSNYATTPAAGTYHGAPWQSTRRPMFSYDRVTWHHFDTQTVASTYIEFRHNTAFTGNTVYISRSRQLSVTQMGQWLADTAAAYPTILVPTQTATAFTPTLTAWPAQSFIADEYSIQLDELGRTIPATPFYAAEINDTSLMPSVGGKRLAMLTAGIHAGEDIGDFPFKACIEYLLGATPAAQNLRRHYRILIYPCLNAPGRYGGGWRGSFTQGAGGADDLNRHFSDASPGLEVITKPRTAMTTDRAGLVPDWNINAHAMYADTWGLFAPVGSTMEATFRTRLATATGYTVLDLGDTSAGSLPTYIYNLGTTLAVDIEMGEPSPVTDAQIAIWGEAVVTALDSMVSDDLFFVVGDGDTQTLTPSLYVDADTFYLQTLMLAVPQTLELTLATSGSGALQKTLTKSASANAVLEAYVAADWDSDSEAWDADLSGWNSVKVTQLTTGTAILQKSQSKSLSGSGILQKSDTKTASGSATLQQNFTKTASVSAFLLGLRTKLVQASASLQATLQRTVQASAFLGTEGTNAQTITANAVLQKTLTTNTSVSAALATSQAKTSTASAVLQKNLSKITNASAHLTGMAVISCTASVVLFKNGLTTVSASAIISRTGWVDSEAVSSSGWAEASANIGTGWADDASISGFWA